MLALKFGFRERLTSLLLRSFNSHVSQGYNQLVYKERNRLFSPQVHRSLCGTCHLIEPNCVGRNHTLKLIVS